ncbi:MAG: VIT domain-containing protein, partial [Clostridia bacterium]
MKVVDLRELALKKVKITCNVIGKFGTFEIEQVYKNNTKDVLEVGYTFPIVETATVVGFEINVGDKVLKGKCKEKEEAKKEYQRNIVNGNSAYMMEQETDNIFKISIGKIDRDEEVTLKIYYIDKFEITDNTIKILMPTLVTPKYESNITSKLAYGKVNYTIDFNINIDKALNRKSISCPSHKINIIDEEKTERVEVLNYDLSKDFKLDIELKNELSSNAITSKTRDGKNMIYLSFMPEILDSYEDSEKEYLFIIDVSGSMMGEKLDETKRAVIECLKQLDVGDKFNIIPFESGFEAMNIKSIEYNEENMQKAIEYINKLRPLGGTEILNPIKFALYEKENDKIILLFTDGQVGNEGEIIRYVEDNINRSRIFPFGIDTNVNSSFIKQLAKVGNGKAELIQPKERIDDKIIRTFARIQTPLLEKLEIDYGTNKLIDEIREEKCLFNYEFFNVFAKIEKLEDDIKLKGKILNKEYVWK